MTATRLTLAVGSLVSLSARSCCDAKGVQRLHEEGGYIWHAVVDNNRPSRIARRFAIIESIFENGISIIGSILEDRRAMCKGRLLSTTRKLLQEESRQPDEISPSSWRNLSSRSLPQGSLGVEDSRNGTDRATERSGPWNGPWNETERTVLHRF